MKKWSIFGPLIFFNLRYIKGGVRGNNNIGIKKCTTNFLWVLNFGQVGGNQKNFENRWGNSPTWSKFYSHKKVVLHFFILMLLLPKTPPLTYPNIKKFKGPKMDSLHFHFHFHFTSLSLHKDGGRRSIAGIAQHSTPISIKESPFSKIFPLIWVSSISSKNWTHLQFYKRNPFKNESDQKKGLPKNSNHLQFYKRNPFNFFFFNKFLKENYREIPLQFFQKKK